LASAGQFDGQGDPHTPKPYVRQAFRKYLECASLPMALPGRGVMTAVTTTSWPIPEKAVVSAPHATRDAWLGLQPPWNLRKKLSIQELQGYPLTAEKYIKLENCRTLGDLA